MTSSRRAHAGEKTAMERDAGDPCLHCTLDINHLVAQVWTSVIAVLSGLDFSVYL